LPKLHQSNHRPYLKISGYLTELNLSTKDFY